MNPPHSAQAPTSDQVLNHARRLRKEPAAAAEWKIVEHSRCERVLDVKKRDGSVQIPRRAQIDIAWRADVQVHEAYIPRVRSVIKTLGKGVIRRERQSFPEAALEAGGAGLIDAIGRSIVLLIQNLESQVLGAEIGRANGDQRPARVPAAQRIVHDWRKRIEAARQECFRHVSRDWIDIGRRQEEMSSFCAAV